MVRCKKCGHVDNADVPYHGETSFEGEQHNPGECGGFVIKCSCGSTSFDIISQTPGHFPVHTPGHTGGINVEHQPSPTINPSTPSGSSFDRIQASLDRIEQKLQEMDNRLKSKP